MFGMGGLAAFDNIPAHVHRPPRSDGKPNNPTSKTPRQSQPQNLSPNNALNPFAPMVRPPSSADLQKVDPMLRPGKMGTGFESPRHNSGFSAKFDLRVRSMSPNASASQIGLGRSVSPAKRQGDKARSPMPLPRVPSFFDAPDFGSIGRVPEFGSIGRVPEFGSIGRVPQFTPLTNLQIFPDPAQKQVVRQQSPMLANSPNYNPQAMRQLLAAMQGTNMFVPQFLRKQQTPMYKQLPMIMPRASNSPLKLRDLGGSPPMTSGSIKPCSPPVPMRMQSAPARMFNRLGRKAKYEVGDKIEVWSRSGNSWRPGHVEAVNGPMVWAHFQTATGQWMKKGIPENNEHVRHAQNF
jgi:hypothetical protein